MNIDKKRVYSELKTLGEIGYEAGVGTTRVAYSPKFFEGREYVKSLMEDAGLAVTVDSVGSLIGVREGSEPGTKIISMGSHVDSVPGGGMFDGCLGVLGAVECIRTMDREGYKNRHPLEVIAFVEEEGNAVGGTFGSKCFVGGEPTEGELAKAASFGVTLENIRAAKKNAEEYEAYLELHIEQGGVLENEKKEIGIVGGIVGISRYRATVAGDANHAGTTPMNLRNDAMSKSAEMILELNRRVSERQDGMVCTVGIFNIPGGAANVISEKTEFILEARSPSSADVAKVISQWARDFADKGLTLEPFLNQSETLMDSGLSDMMESICKAEGYSYKRMFSGAGHDAMNMAEFTKTAMIFVPSIGGISHSIKELSSEEDIGKGVNVLYQLMKEADK